MPTPSYIHTCFLSSFFQSLHDLSLVKHSVSFTHIIKVYSLLFLPLINVRSHVHLHSLCINACSSPLHFLTTLSLSSLLWLMSTFTLTINTCRSRPCTFSSLNEYYSLSFSHVLILSFCMFPLLTSRLMQATHSLPKIVHSFTPITLSFFHDALSDTHSYS